MSSVLNNKGRPTAPETVANDRAEPLNEMATSTGNRGLMLEEKLIFEQDNPGACGVDLPEITVGKLRLGGIAARDDIGLPCLDEPSVVRHYTRLSQKNYAIDAGLYPLGSCTMKHNPRLNEKMARLPGFADIHPLQPFSSVQGALKLMHELAHWLKTLTNMDSVALSPAAGAHGELCGLAAIHAAHAAREGAGPKTVQQRRVILVPESAHGTNPATAAFLGYEVQTIPAGEDGRVTAAAVRAHLSDNVAAIMLTNPNTCGLFEREIKDIADAVHEAGAYFYCDGANFNAIVGRVRPGDLGIDAMHINLHKTFSTPHGGGGPGSGPVVFSKALSPFVPLPYLRMDGTALTLQEWFDDAGGQQPFGRLKAFHGQMGMFVRALSYMLSHGADGLWQAAGDAVLNANYLLASLKSVLNVPFPAPCMHEVLFDDSSLKGTGLSTLDIAKGLLDEGFHPMTMYFPLVVHGAMLIEPTESENKASLDQFVGAMKHLLAKAHTDPDSLKTAPHFTPRRRLDETRAARKPILRWVDKAV